MVRFHPIRIYPLPVYILKDNSSPFTTKLTNKQEGYREIREHFLGKLSFAFKNEYFGSKSLAKRQQQNSRSTIQPLGQ